jgi:hypothetical protein
VTNQHKPGDLASALEPRYCECDRCGEGTVTTPGTDCPGPRGSIGVACPGKMVAVAPRPRPEKLPTFTDKLVARVGKGNLVRLYTEGGHGIYGQLAWADEDDVCLIWTGGPEVVPVHRICAYRVATDGQRMSEAAIEKHMAEAEELRSPWVRVHKTAPSVHVHTICVHEKPPWECEECQNRYDQRKEQPAEPHVKAMAELEVAFGARDWAACHEAVQYLDALFSNMKEAEVINCGTTSAAEILAAGDVRTCRRCNDSGTLPHLDYCTICGTPFEEGDSGGD